MADELLGSLYVPAAVGRSLGRGDVALRVADVLCIAGVFAVGDRVHVVTRGVDGGQGIVGIAIVAIDASELANGRADAQAVVMQAGGFESRW